MNVNVKPRIEWLDTLKLIGIFYIYLGHLGKDAGKLYPFVFSFHVPLFFFISGLVFKAPEGFHDSFQKIKTTFKRVIIPYFVFSIIGITIYTIKWNYPVERVFEMLLEVLMGVRNKVPMASLWFLPCLFVVVIYYIIANLIFKKPLIIFLLSLMIFCLTPSWFKHFPTSFFNVDSALHYLSYFSLGVLLSEKVKYEWPLIYEEKSKTGIISLILLSLIYFWYAYQNGTFFIIKDLKPSEIKYFSIFILTCVMFIPSMAISYCINIKSFKIMGENTLALCGTEQIIKVITLSFISMLGLNPQFKDPLQAILFVLLCLTISYFTVVKIYAAFSLIRRKL